jgi:hypothetical protein
MVMSPLPNGHEPSPVTTGFFMVMSPLPNGKKATNLFEIPGSEVAPNQIKSQKTVVGGLSFETFCGHLFWRSDI